ncbi:MAG: chromosome segregation protein SMC [Daejeonella sp.]
MQLTQLEIKGFKSFGDKITINFNDGVTAIVGPNGCGKSNVVDAIRWVLGEQSTRMLRSEKMENIIFNGTNTRKPSNLAEVSLTFDNTRNILPTDYSSVTITRKLYRSGESEYRLNDVQCRLKDITDLFLDTGIGSDSYSIIELKMIDEIIANKDNSRRALFEEASGISKYKLRKKQTFNKLKDAEADLSRVDDLLFEIEKNLKTLENQAKKAERYYRLKDQYKNLSLLLASYKIRSFGNSLSRLEDREQQQLVENSGISTTISNLEALLQKQKLDSLNLEKNLSVQQKATNEFISRIRAYESDKKIKNEQLKFLEDKKSRLSEELEKDRNQLNHIFYNQKRLNEEHLQESEILEKLRSSVNVKHSDLEKLRLKQQKSKGDLDVANRDNMELQNQAYKLEKDIAILNIQKEALYQESSRNVADTQSKESELNEFNKVIAEIQGNLEIKHSELKSAGGAEDELQLQIIRITEQSAEEKELLNQESRRLDSRQNEYNLTKSMVDNLEGFPESIRFLKKNAGWVKQAILFSDILFCKEEYRIAIENYLEPVMNHYVVETQQEAVQAIRLLSEASRGRANFFILDALTAHPQRTAIQSNHASLIPAMDIIDADSKYRPLCEMLLYNVFLIQSGEEEELKSALPAEQIVLLSKSGMFSKTRTGMSGGSVGLFEGKRIGRAKNLEKLFKEIDSLEKTILKLKNSIDEKVSQLNVLKESSQTIQIQQQQLELNRLSNEFTSVKTNRNNTWLLLRTAKTGNKTLS